MTLLSSQEVYSYILINIISIIYLNIIVGNLFQLGGKSSEEYIISVLKGIKMNELENSLKFVHMTYI